MKLQKHLEKLGSEYPLQNIVEELIKLHSWDKVCLCFSNFLVIRSNAAKMKGEKAKAKELYASARMFHKVVEDKENEC